MHPVARSQGWIFLGLVLGLMLLRTLVLQVPEFSGLLPWISATSLAVLIMWWLPRRRRH